MSYQAIFNILNCDEKLTFAARRAFAAVDIDKSGIIEIQELNQLIIEMASDMGEEHPSIRNLKEVLDRLDKDKSGKIEFNEFKLFIREIFQSILVENE